MINLQLKKERGVFIYNFREEEYAYLDEVDHDPLRSIPFTQESSFHEMACDRWSGLDMTETHHHMITQYLPLENPWQVKNRSSKYFS